MCAVKSCNCSDRFCIFVLSFKVEQFWAFYSYLVRPGDLSGHSDIHLFKDGIKPMWEVCCHISTLVQYLKVFVSFCCVAII